MQVGQVVKLASIDSAARGVVIKLISSEFSEADCIVVWMDYGEIGNYARLAMHEEELEVVWG